MSQIILASGSPRRKRLLEQVGINCLVKIPNVDEDKVKTKDPIELVKHLAEIKGNNIELSKGQILISADTVIHFGDQILTKPNNEKEAYQMLSALRGQTHFVHTGVMIRSLLQQQIFTVKTAVEFWDVSNQELAGYIDSGERRDKAAGYGIQAKGAFLVKAIKGDYYNVVGLPISTVVQKLKEFNIYPFDSSK